MQIRSIFRFEKGSLKRKIVGLFLAMVLIIALVIVVSKIFFPDPASDAVFASDYQYTSTAEYSKFEEDMNSASNWFVANLSEQAEKDEMGETISIFNDQAVLIEKLAEKNTFVQNKNGLKNLLKSLNGIKNDMIKSRQKAQDYYDDQLKRYIQTGSFTAENTSKYYETLNKLFNEYICYNQKYVSVMLKISANCTINTTTDSPLAKVYREIVGEWGNKVIENRNKSILAGEEINQNEQLRYFTFLDKKVLTYSDTEYYANPNSYETIIDAIKSQNLQIILDNYATDNWANYFDKKKEDDQNEILLIVALVEGV